jgi:tetratricopeptide (TPR) repeat protein
MRRVFQGSGPSEYFSLIFYAENLVWLDRVDEARALLTDERVEIAARIDDRTSVETLAVLAHACQHQGLARVILDQLAAGSQRFVHNSVIAMHLRGPIDHSVALAHATLGQHEQAIAALKRAIACSAEHGGRPVLAHLQRLLARWTEAAPALEPSRAAPIHAPAEVPQLDEHGATWTLRFAGRSATVRASRGVTMLAELLRRPGVEVHVLDLVHGEGERAKVDEGDAGELLDAEARAAYRRRAEALREELEQAEGFHDLARAEALRAEFEALTDELSRGVGLSGASRRAAGAAERARVNVRKRLRHAIQAIAEVHPELGRHLDATVRTGIFCEYRPL